MTSEKIIIQGARQHNLKNIDVELPRNKLVVITAFPAPANQHWPSTPSTPKVNADMSNLFRPMPVSF